MTTTRFLKINPVDNVAVAIEPLHTGEKITIDGREITLLSDIPAGHKFALDEISTNQDVIKYGYPIGHAIENLLPGTWVNEKNIRTNLEGILDYSYTPSLVQNSVSSENNILSGRTFEGYLRANGEVGIRNEIWIIPTVGCVNGTVSALAERLRLETQEKNIDGIFAFPHNYGCSQLGDDHENTRKILRDVVLHPNAGGVLVVGLGCENNQLGPFRELLGDYDSQRIKFIETQKSGNEIEESMVLLREIYTVVSQDRRKPVSISKLRVGLKCGGSDGLSGITANPLLGVFSDRLIAAGGTSVLTEVPEMFGAETILMNRCKDRPTFERTVHLINDFKEYFTKNDQPIYENPSPGNKAGGISTLEEKSLGCTQKCGNALVEDVLLYGDRLRTAGLSLLSNPGNDLVASTALAAAGCQLVLFTTGRGTPFGTFVPTMKIATNSILAKNKPHWIDFNAGVIVQDKTISDTCNAFTEYILSVASGEQVNNEKNGFREIAIFKSGVTL